MHLDTIYANQILLNIRRQSQCEESESISSIFSLLGQKLANFNFVLILNMFQKKNYCNERSKVETSLIKETLSDQVAQTFHNDRRKRKLQVALLVLYFDCDACNKIRCNLWN